jgi:Toastrack DUF4097
MRTSLLPSTLAATVLWPVALFAQTPTLTCDQRWGNDEGERVCEVRAVPITNQSHLVVDGGPNGGIRVRGWDQNETRLWVRVEANAPSESRARELAQQVDIQTDGTIRADGPSSHHREWWSASYELLVPRGTDLDLETVNGGVRISDVHSRVRFAVTNGGVHLSNLGGDVSGRTMNGGVVLELSGDAWDGTGADVTTTNGGVQVVVPERYNAHLITGTTNGSLSFDFPVMVQGRINRRLETDLGSGGPSIRAVTTNGSVRVRRAGL